MQKELKRVGTHNGRFHADETMATAILQEIFDIELVRTRDMEVLKTLDLIYDVGDGEFDHHQVDKEYRETGVPYAACGLIWRKFGRDVIRFREPSLEEDAVEYIFQHIDAMLMEGIDASDNGMRTGSVVVPLMNIPSIIAEFNPPWDSEKLEDEAFMDAVKVASALLNNMLNQQLSIIKARKYVFDAYKNRPRPELLVLERSYPWTQALSEIDVENEVLFVIYPRDNQYLIQTIRRNDGMRGDRKKLPEAWAGKRDEELGNVIGIDDAIFCHSARFIAGAGSMESIMKMADIAIAEPEEVIEEVREAAPVQGFVSALKEFLLKKSISIKR
ncbi:MAG: MYG1 family protein [Clostridia bacterium]|nr:MYG1 family protein [Clostridia bacterium]